MRRNYLYFLAFMVLARDLTLRAAAQDKAADKPAAVAAAPTAGYRAEFLEDVTYYEQRFTRLAEAMPADKYPWRPG